MISPSVATAMPISSAAGKPDPQRWSAPRRLPCRAPRPATTEPITTPADCGRPNAPRHCPTHPAGRQSDGDQAEHREHPSAGGEIGQRAFTPTVAKKITSSRSRVVMFEADLQTEDLVDCPEGQGGDKAAGDRLGNVVGAEERHALRDQHADEEDDDADREGQEVRCDDVACFGHVSLSLAPPATHCLLQARRSAANGGSSKHGGPLP